MSRFLVASGIYTETLRVLGPPQSLVGQWWVPVVSAAQGCSVPVHSGMSWCWGKTLLLFIPAQKSGWGEARQAGVVLWGGGAGQQQHSAPSPHTHSSPSSSPRLLPCSQHREERAQAVLPPPAAAAVSRHSFPWVPYLAGLIPPAPAGCLVIAAGPKYPAPPGPAMSGACTGQAWRSLPASAGLGLFKNSSVCMECSFSGEQSFLQTCSFPIVTPAQEMR